MLRKTFLAVLVVVPALLAGTMFLASCSKEENGGGGEKCTVDGNSYNNGEVNPLNGCQICDTGRSTAQWSNNDGAACNDGIFCNGTDACESGQCSVHAGDPCVSPMECSEDAGMCILTINADLFKFGVFGDSRPATNGCIATTAGCVPSDIVTYIIQAMVQNEVQFVLGVGDWMFCDSSDAMPPGQTLNSCVDSHIQGFLDAVNAGNYTGPIYNMAGNHECNTSTDKNCPNENETYNMQQYMQRIKLPAFPHSYFDFSVQTNNESAHIIASNPNAWNSAQQAWLSGAAAKQSDYIFYLQHEPPDSDPAAPGQAAAYGIMQPYAVTLYMYGHLHSYKKIASNQIILGNGGAPLGGTDDWYGFGIVEQLTDGNVQVTIFKLIEATGDIQQQEQFTLTPQGSPVE